MKQLKFILILFVLIIIYCCKKTNNQQIDPESGIDYIGAEFIFANIFETVSNSVQKDSLLKKLSNDSIPLCMQINDTSRGNTYPKKVTIVFDTVNSCSNEGVIYDGATYKGEIIVQMSSSFKTKGTAINITPVNLYVNGDKVTGQISITNNGRNSGNLTFEMKVINGIIYTKNGNIHYTSDKTWTWTQGESTPYPAISDDIYHVNGTASGINIDNNNFSVQTPASKYLTIQMGCQWKIIKGKVEVIPENAQTITVDYGDSICDNNANLLIGNNAPIPVAF